jgi:hypothetical protein
MTRKWFGDTYGYICNHCGDTTDEINSNNDWRDVGQNKSGDFLNKTIEHFCPKCYMARKLIKNSTEHRDILSITGNEPSLKLENVRTHQKALSQKEIDALFYFEINR